MKRLLLIGLLAIAQPANAQEVVDQDFTISVPRGPGQDDLVESTTLVPLLPGTCYTWHLRLANTKGAVAVTEVYSLPSAPESWDLAGDTTIVVADDKRSATSTLSLKPDDGWIGHGWCVAAGDPEGSYTFKILDGERVLGFFEFELRQM